MVFLWFSYGFPLNPHHSARVPCRASTPDRVSAEPAEPAEAAEAEKPKVSAWERLKDVWSGIHLGWKIPPENTPPQKINK